MIGRSVFRRVTFENVKERDRRRGRERERRREGMNVPFATRGTAH